MIVTSSQLRLMINEEIRCMVRHQYTINKINAMAHNTYGIQLTEHLSFHDQVYIMESVGFNTPCSDAVNAMTLCSIVRDGSSNGRQPINEVALLAIGQMALTGRGLKFGAEALTWVVGFIAKRVGISKYRAAMQDVTGELGAACEEAGLDPEDATKAYCKNMATKLTDSVRGLVKAIEDKFLSLLTYIAAVMKFKTLKPTEEQKIVGEPIAKRILSYVNNSIALLLLGKWIIVAGNPVSLIIASILAGLSVAGAVATSRALDKAPKTLENARAELERRKEEELQAIQAEVA